MRRWRAISMVAIVFTALATPGRLLAQAPAALSPDSPEVVPKASEGFQYFAFVKDPHYNVVEQGALWVVLLVAVAGLLYAAMLVGQVLGADQGTEKMRTV